MVTQMEQAQENGQTATFTRVILQMAFSLVTVSFSVKKVGGLTKVNGSRGR